MLFTLICADNFFCSRFCHVDISLIFGFVKKGNLTVDDIQLLGTATITIDLFHTQLLKNAVEVIRQFIDLILHIRVEVPRRLNEKQKELLRQFADTATGREYEGRKSFLDKVKELFNP